MFEPSPAAKNLLERMEAMGPEFEASNSESEAERRIPSGIVASLKKAGAYRMTMPRDWGGYELSPAEQILVLETIARRSASVAWCVMIGSDGGIFSGFLEPEAARRIYEDIDAVTGSGIMPVGRAVRVDGGFELSGKWSFGSGCQHADWMAAGALVYDGDTPCENDLGFPEARVLLLPASNIEIHDTWYTTGLWGSGSNDWSVEKTFVPEAHTFDIMSPTTYREGPLYQVPNIFFWNFPGVALGVARAALDYVIDLAQRKTNMMFGTPLAAEAHIASSIGQAEAKLQAARAFVLDATEAAWQSLCAPPAPRSEDSPFHPGAAYSRIPIEQRVRHRLAMNFVHGECMQVVQIAYKAAGGSAVYRRNPMDRYLRDITTINQHAVISEKTYETAGRVLTGDEPDQPFF